MALHADNRNGDSGISARIRFLLWCAVLLTVFVNTTAYATGTRHKINPQTGIETWQTRDHGVFLSLTQLTPGQAEAFLLARGFDRKSAEAYAAACVFGAIFRNESVSSPVSYNLADWRIVTPHSERKLKLKSDWARQWKARGVSESARIAFRWSQFPTKQRFAPGDWSQGMTTYVLPRGGRFNLKFKWTVKGVTHEGLLSGIRCAANNGSR
ncbi:MAG TPA: hypothetical protein DEP05_09345 [Betaproteobacteria bacterium]|nr:hypothetical protein [Betaproteobacteria bacterium]